MEIRIVISIAFMYLTTIMCGALFHLDAKSAARGGMLHDLFLYDWHTHARETGERLHGFTHAEKAYKECRKDIPSEPCGARCDPKSYVAGDTRSVPKDKRRGG